MKTSKPVRAGCMISMIRLKEGVEPVFVDFQKQSGNAETFYLRKYLIFLISKLFEVIMFPCTGEDLILPKSPPG